MEKDITSSPITVKELKMILKMSEEGFASLFNDHIKKRYTSYLNSLNLKESLDFLTINVSFLQTPILVDELRLVCGFNELEMNRFLPKDIKNVNTLYA